MTRPESVSFDLYFDESGLFIETSTDPAERVQSHRQKRKFASQLAGLLAPRGRLEEAAASDVLSRCRKAAGLTESGPFHATECRPGADFDRLVETCVTECRNRGWQPVRLVNQEGVSFGDRVANYTNLVAEMLLRVFQWKEVEGIQKPSLRVIAARVVLSEDDRGVLHFLEHTEYRSRIDEYLTRCAVRRGLDRKLSTWVIDDFKIGSGRRDPRLQICDLISNASHDNFDKCGDDARQLLIQIRKPPALLVSTH